MFFKSEIDAEGRYRTIRGQVTDEDGSEASRRLVVLRVILRNNEQGDTAYEIPHRLITRSWSKDREYQLKDSARIVSILYRVYIEEEEEEEGAEAVAPPPTEIEEKSTGQIIAYYMSGGKTFTVHTARKISDNPHTSNLQSIIILDTLSAMPPGASRDSGVEPPKHFLILVPKHLRKTWESEFEAHSDTSVSSDDFFPTHTRSTLFLQQLYTLSNENSTATNKRRLNKWCEKGGKLLITRTFLKKINEKEKMSAADRKAYGDFAERILDSKLMLLLDTSARTQPGAASHQEERSRLGKETLVFQNVLFFVLLGDILAEVVGGGGITRVDFFLFLFFRGGGHCRR